MVLGGTSSGDAKEFRGSSRRARVLPRCWLVAHPLPPVQSTADPLAVSARDGPATPEDLLARMSLKRKVAQIIMPDIGSITPRDVRRLPVRHHPQTVAIRGRVATTRRLRRNGSRWPMLSGKPRTRLLRGGEPAVPALWATDAVHGHANIIGATVFPHNIRAGRNRGQRPDPPGRCGDRGRNRG